MNYNDEILENKTFIFFKKLMYNIALSICIVLFVALMLVFCFKFRLYNVLTNSQRPYFKAGDIVVVRPENNLKVGDIIKFEKAGLPITHRLIGIVQDGNKTYYVTHGDNNPKLTGAEDDSWQANAKVIEGKSYAEISSMSNIEISPRENVEGKVIGWFSNYGTYVDYIKNHTLVIVAIFLGMWCISSAYQNEAELKRMRRLA